MPAQKFVDKHSLKILNMEPSRIPNNNSHQNLMNDDGVTSNSADTKNGANRTNIESGVSRKQILTVGVLCFVNLINYMDRYTIAGILTSIKAHYGLADDQTGLLQTAFVVSYMLFAPLFGYLGDRYSRRIIMAAGVFLWCLTTLLGSYMENYHWFLFFRMLVGVGEASYSTIAPTIISDLFVLDVRSRMLAWFYFAIPVGSGFGYIVGSEMEKLSGTWQNGLRVTPILGIIAVVLIIFVMTDPERGQSEGKSHLHPTSYTRDVKLLLRNPSFMLSTVGFTCVTFVTGALAWWGPHFILLGLKMQPGNESLELGDVSFKFGVITMVSGLLGVPAGALLAQKLRVSFPRADPYICACGLLISAPLLFGAAIYVSSNIHLCYLLIFLGELSINLNWSIVADILLYVVVPTRRSSAEAFQILISHMFGDAGSPYLIGVISEALKKSLVPGGGSGGDPSNEVKFHSLQYALFTTNFVEVLGGLFFLFTALYIVQDKEKAERDIAGNQRDDSLRRVVEIPLLRISDMSSPYMPKCEKGR